MPTYDLKTPRLGLRLLKKEDIHYLLDLESDPEVQRFSFYGVKDYSLVETIIDEMLLDYEKYNLPCFLIFNLESGEFMGRAGFFMWKTGDTEVGYSFHKKFWGNGFATEVLTKLLEWAKTHVTAEYIDACCAVENAASIRIVEKCGMQFYKEEIDKDIRYHYYRIKNR